jgi:hypothetical protein
MAKSKTLIISGPMDAKHVGGINVMGNRGLNIDNYFTSTAIVPDDSPSHTFMAVGKTEIPRRSDTIASTIRRPSISLKRSISKLRRSSSSHPSEPHHKVENEQPLDKPMSRSESPNTHRPLRMQSSMSRLRQRVGLDRELYVHDRKALARLTTASSIYTTMSDSEPARTSILPHRQSSIIQRQSSTIPRRPSPIERQPSNANQQPPQPPSRPTRADSGTAIDFNNIPVQERPIPFKEIMAVSSFADRMAMYKKTREYWASADHGLVTWTERAVGPKATTARS